MKLTFSCGCCHILLLPAHSVESLYLLFTIYLELIREKHVLLTMWLQLRIDAHVPSVRATSHFYSSAQIWKREEEEHLQRAPIIISEDVEKQREGGGIKD